MKMKKIYFLIIFSVFFGGFVISKSFTKLEPPKIIFESYSYEIQEGDLIFQTSLSSQSQAIQFATKSIYSHCGILFQKDNEFYVLEAVQPVKFTKLEKWIQRGKGKKFVIKRLKNANTILNLALISEMKKKGRRIFRKRL